MYNSKSGYVTLTTPLSGQFVIDRLGHAMANVHTKFEVLSFTHYRDMKCVAKYTKWGGLGWLGVTQGHQQCHHSIECI